MLRLRYDGGTLVLEGPHDSLQEARALCPSLAADRRIGGLRAPAVAYREVLTRLTRAGIAFEDEARAYREVALRHLAEREPYVHQTEAVDAWIRGGRRGVVVLPTGSGKTHVAELAMVAAARSTLVVAPTIDLMNQWYDTLTTAFGVHLGVVGGGAHDVADVTVTTYDSAYRHMEKLGARFGLVIYDEVHHLPGPSYSLAAEGSLAPFRLGLTATPERADDGMARIAHLTGPIVYRRDLSEMAGGVLSPYEIVRLRVPLTDEERERYDLARGCYLDFVRARGIRLSGGQGFRRFLRETSRCPEGRQAFKGYREQRAIALCCVGKRRLLRALLWQHRTDRTLIFTHENATAYDIAREHLIPPLTHQTSAAERRWILSAFREGEVNAIVTSRVLNEGVDVPRANVAVVMSGSASVREHVQRLGRILRRAEGKEAVLYELIAAGTSEEGMSERRRDHRAYQS